jgi:hypothetical protein
MKKTIVVVLIIGLAVIAWRIIRVNSYSDTDKTVTLPNGLKVFIHLGEVSRVGSNKVRITMELRWTPSKGEKLVVPDLTLTRPSAVRSATLDPQIDSAIEQANGRDRIRTGMIPDTGWHQEDGIHHVRYTACFQLRESAGVIDIAQPLYCQKPSDTVHVDLPIVARFRRRRTISPWTLDRRDRRPRPWTI